MQGRESGEHDTERKSCPISALEEVRSRRPPCKVLLVDDEPSILIVLHWALQDIGCEVTSAHGGQAGLDALCKDSFDILITDLIMPDLDGFFLLKMAEKLDPEMKVIVMTGSPELVPAIVDAGSKIDGLLIKPFGLNKLKNLIGRCIDEAQHEQSPAALRQNLAGVRS